MTGVRSVIYPAASLVLFTLGLWLFRTSRQSVLVALLLMGVFIDFKVFGTNRRFNAVTGNTDIFFRGDARLGGHQMSGLEDSVYLHLLDNPGYRVALYEGPQPTDLRIYGLSTPQGFDPFLTDQFKKAVETFQPFRTNRLFDIDPLNDAMLRHFGIRWIFVRGDTTMERTLLQHPDFRRLGTGSSFYNVFEYRSAQPAWRYEGDVQMTRWEPERRVFRVQSPVGGEFVLKEQYFPGWTASVDGREFRVERTEGTFQSVPVPSGEHSIEFRYRPFSLVIGAVISALAVLATLLIAIRS
jgi:hypothetical protein